MLLKKIIEIKGILHCDTGLRIGGSKDTIEIGGLDNPIIRHPITEYPYIPGSSFKGKLRSLLESVYGRKFKGGGELTGKFASNPCMCGKCDICKIFGAHQNTTHQLGPTRLIVRDFPLTDESIEKLIEARLEKGLHFSETKAENTIKRESGTAHNPRVYERVPEGTEFNVNMTLKIYDIDDQTKIVNIIKQGLKLLESDYLGSSGSRGYGKVSFRNLQFIEKDIYEKISVE
ncbi:type III-A CRISPR-associated RAMP protein Csm3 [Calidifontibacillus erzurumensis]|uniref:CRISPR system Cms endoribonuclease Csm3 n=1 Tax=Calidifontibacillus erzurumensis TaxID=2741433 RepID=A0A8J8GFK9_9BACI|nr:type III-A CRISPR-associated RAMP protein Csm3 [Calidifontibacillus erzurumensis]NSL53040.1 type III-A CRISPR-associated RAMP protein Csm3 [Calidifontibacillus erzurumensis]